MNKRLLSVMTGTIIAGALVIPFSFNTTSVYAAQSGWVKENGGYKYYKNNKAYTGWHYMSKAEGEKTPHWSYFGKDGKIYTGWRNMGKNEGEKITHWSYFGDNGWLRTGWQQMGTKINPDGKNKAHWSYFGSNGWLRTGWVQLGKGTSEPDGNSSKHWSYFGDNGWLRTGWQSMGKGTSNPDGNSTKHTSYFGNNGWLVINKTFSLSGKTYKADGKGWLTEIKSKTPSNSGTKNNSGNSYADITNAKYILNTKTMKIHKSVCNEVIKMNSGNKAGCNNKQEAIDKGYSPCKKCNP